MARPDLDDLTQLIRSQVAALNRHDLDSLMELYADDAVLEFPASRPVTGRRAIRHAFERYFRDWQEQVTLQRVVAVREMVNAEGTVEGRHRSVQLKIPGQTPIPLRAYRHQFAASWEIQDGKIRRHRVSFDADDLVRQLLGIE